MNSVKQTLQNATKVDLLKTYLLCRERGLSIAKILVVYLVGKGYNTNTKLKKAFHTNQSSNMYLHLETLESKGMLKEVGRSCLRSVRRWEVTPTGEKAVSDIFPVS